ncbi:MAG: putative NBD/HSP70 family sugar kinase [Verrucomicrobiales bacterium]|jgi:predicted NBD/HSP70 family sugar kinase
MSLEISCKFSPPLDPGHVPAVLWNRAFQKRVEDSGNPKPIGIALEQPDGSVSVYRTAITPDDPTLNLRYAERLVKFLLWARGGNRVLIGEDTDLAKALASIYSSNGERAFDFHFLGEKAYLTELEFVGVALDELPEERESAMELGGHLDGCRIGFDLGGSDRKCAAVIDGEVVFSEEIEWDPYFQKDPQYHLDGIRQSLKSAAAHLPRIDAIGGSAAGVYVNNEVRVGSLFRGVADDVFDARVRRMFFDLQEEWGGVPFVIVNDGDVTALAGSMATGDHGVLGIAMGTSEAVGFVTPEGRITRWLNELAFAPVDYQENAPADEWSGDPGVGAQYFSQQAVGRLATTAGFEFEEGVPLPERLKAVQAKMEAGDPAAAGIFETIGRYFGYAVAHYADFYDIRQILALGRVTSGAGGDLLLAEAKKVLGSEFPELAESIQFRQPGEKEKRHGQAIAAASLPAIVTR